MTDIIIVTYKPAEACKDQLVAIRANTTEYQLIFTGLNDSASVNRNFGLRSATSDIVVMLDDDISGFYPGWLNDLIKPLLEDKSILIASARLLNPNGGVGPCMGADGLLSKPVMDANKSGYKGYRRLPTACLAFRNNSVRFNESFKGSGYEDTAWMNELNQAFPEMRFVVNNGCKLVHANEQKRQGGKYWEHNKAVYLSLYPDDQTVIQQKDWTGGKENE